MVTLMFYEMVNRGIVLMSMDCSVFFSASPAFIFKIFILVDEESVGCG